MANNLNDLKVDAIDRGYWFIEMASREKKGAIALEVGKLDDDNVRFTVTLHFTKSDYLNYQFRFDAYYQGIDTVTKIMEKRNSKDISNCEHQFITVGDRKRCTLCKGNFGTEMTLRLMDN